MARKKKADTKEEETRQLIAEVNTLIFDSDAADGPERQLMVDDLNFVYDEEGQWDQATKTQRAGRPCYTFNRVQQPVNQVLGEQRQNSVSIKIRAVDDKSDPDLAEVQGGMIRNIVRGERNIIIPGRKRAGLQTTHVFRYAGPCYAGH